MYRNTERDFFARSQTAEFIDLQWSYELCLQHSNPICSAHLYEHPLDHSNAASCPRKENLLATIATWEHPAQWTLQVSICISALLFLSAFNWVSLVVLGWPCRHVSFLPLFCCYCYSSDFSFTLSDGFKSILNTNNGIVKNLFCSVVICH